MWSYVVTNKRTLFAGLYAFAVPVAPTDAAQLMKSWKTALNLTKVVSVYALGKI